MPEIIIPAPNEGVAERLYELFLTDENAPVWGELTEVQKRIWLLRSSSVMQVIEEA